MKILKLLFSLFFIFSVTIVSAQRLEFESVERENGTAFFAIDKATGQVSFMLDYGSESGIWKSFGGTVPK